MRYNAISSLRRLCAVALVTLVPSLSHAGALDLVSQTDAVGALRLALEKGAGTAIANLGQSGGFMNNPEVRIPLPSVLQKSERLLKMLGKGDDLKRLQASMNQAAEMAVPKARELMMNAVKSMSVTDAKAILAGPEDSVTQFFRSKTSEPLQQKFLPIVTAEVSKLDIANQYNALASQASKVGLVKGEASSVEGFVTAKALDGLYAMIAKEEKAIRANPLQAGSQLLGKVFGAMK